MHSFKGQDVNSYSRAYSKKQFIKNANDISCMERKIYWRTSSCLCVKENGRCVFTMNSNYLIVFELSFSVLLSLLPYYYY